MVLQLSVFLQNKSGKIASITKALHDAGVDIRALTIADTTDFGILRMLVSDIQTAKDALAKHNCIVSVNEVTVVAVPDEPGSLSKILDLLAHEKIDIEYMYPLYAWRKRRIYGLPCIGRKTSSFRPFSKRYSYRPGREAGVKLIESR